MFIFADVALQPFPLVIVTVFSSIWFSPMGMNGYVSTEKFGSYVADTIQTLARDQTLNNG